MTAQNPPVYNADQTAKLLPFPSLVKQIEQACTQLAQGKVHAPERQVVPFPQGGVMLSMPATASDIGIHKLVNVTPDNRASGLPTIHGLVSAFDGKTGQALMVLDGPTVTSRRTAALSMLGIQVFRKQSPRHVALIGCGVQASGHISALADIYPGIQVSIIGRTLEKAHAFIQQHKHLPLALHAEAQVPQDADTVITVTTSSTPVYDLSGQADRLIVAVGAFKPDLAEIGKTTLDSSVLYTDELAGARHEAGDFIQAEVDWSTVIPLSTAISSGVDLSRPVVYKTVGCAAWDLAAARCAVHTLKTDSLD